MTRPLARSWRNRSISLSQSPALLGGLRGGVRRRLRARLSAFDGRAGRHGGNAFQQLNENDGEAACLALAIELEMTVRPLVVRLGERFAQLLGIRRSGAGDGLGQNVDRVVAGRPIFAGRFVGTRG